MWQPTWEQVKERHRRWWHGEGLIVATWGNGYRKEGEPWGGVSAHGEPGPTPPAGEPDPAARWRDPEQVAARLRADMARRAWPGDMLPVAWADIGTVCLAPYLGAGCHYGANNVWYSACIDDPDTHPPLQFDCEHPEVQRLEAVLAAAVAAAAGDYLVGMPAIIANLDVLAELRGASELMFDLIDRPDWVRQSLDQIHAAWRNAWERMYRLVRADDGSMAFGYFMLWGPGRTSLLQCDTSAMISPEMFRQLVLPELERECEFLDYSMYHVDGHQAIPHLDAVLSLEKLNAVEWTPDPQVPPGGDPHWLPMYRKIRAAGKSLWIAGARLQQLPLLLDSLGPDGLYITLNVADAREFEAAVELVDRWR